MSRALLWPRKHRPPHRLEIIAGVRGLCLWLFIGAVAAFPAQARAQSFLDQVFGLSEDQEIQIGREAARQVEGQVRVVRVSRVNHYLNEVGRQLARQSGRPSLRYTFKLVEEESINAFALPGGFLYVHTGLIAAAQTESELAGVLAHEIGHVSGRHHSKMIARQQAVGLGASFLGSLLGSGGQPSNFVKIVTQLVAGGAFMKFSRDDERDADQRGGNPGAIELFFSTHPSPAERRANIEQLIAGLPPNPALVRDRPQFQRIRSFVLNDLQRARERGYPARRLPPFLRPGPRR